MSQDGQDEPLPVLGQAVSDVCSRRTVASVKAVGHAGRWMANGGVKQQHSPPLQMLTTFSSQTILKAKDFLAGFAFAPARESVMTHRPCFPG